MIWRITLLIKKEAHHDCPSSRFVKVALLILDTCCSKAENSRVSVYGRWLQLRPASNNKIAVIALRGLHA